MASRHPLTELAPGRVRIAPSILAADFCRLGEEIRRVEQAGAEVLHLDIMDGHFVPNLSVGPPVVASVRAVTALPLDVHLMLTDPGRYIEPFLRAGADHITLHIESNGEMEAMLARIHDAGASAGLTLRPGTPAAQLEPYVGLVDLILVMTVEPGFGGQSFMYDQLDKIRWLRALIDRAGRPIHLEVDGGIGRETAPVAVGAGAELLVAGNSVFRAAEGVAAALEGLRG
jgi:ribulose-phosphate 3-epimerase